MKIYLVGGAVRDALLGLPVRRQRLGSSEQYAAGDARRGLPAGRPRFCWLLHPQTHEEYALARTERKSGSGYTGFTCYAAPDVTLEDDLKRRDLTINALAQDDNGEIIDPYDGLGNLQNRLLRHVSPLLAKIRYAYCAWRVLLRVMPTSVFVLPMKLWR